MKQTKREKLLKKKIKRRSYGGVLVSKLIPCLVIGGIVSAVACFVTYKLIAPIVHETNLSQQYFLENNLVSEYDNYNGENYEQRVIDYLYALSNSNTYQSAYELFDAENNERIMRSEFIGWACVHTGKTKTQSPDYYTCDTSLMGEAFEHFEKYYDDYFEDVDSYVSMGFEDFYIKDDGTFLPGKGEISLTTFSEPGLTGNSEENTETLESFDFTPADTSGMTHITSGESVRTYANVRGEPNDSIAMKMLDQHRAYLDSSSHSSVHSELGFAGSYSVFRTKLTLPNGKNYYLYSSYYVDESGFCKTAFAVICGFVMFISLVIAFLKAYSTYTKEQAHFAMEDYRRDMTNTMAHDLKTPLMAISGAAENMKNTCDEEKRLHYADMILSNVDYMNGIIGSVLELAKVEQLTRTKKEPVDLRALTEQTAKMYEDVLAEKEIHLNIDGSATVKADSSLMKQAVGNLVSNAVKYTIDGGSIDIKLSDKSLAITNDSREVTNKTPEQLWQPFIKGDNSRSEKLGSGLGLSIVKNICELQGFEPQIEMKDKKFTIMIKF